MTESVFSTNGTQVQTPVDVAPDEKEIKRKRRKRVNRKITDGLVEFLNIPLSLLLPKDALNVDEATALSIALCDAAQANDVIADIIINLTTVGGVSELVGASAAIVGKRAARRVFGEFVVGPDGKPVINDQYALIEYGADTIVKTIVKKDELGQTQEEPDATDSEPKTSRPRKKRGRPKGSSVKRKSKEVEEQEMLSALAEINTTQ